MRKRQFRFWLCLGITLVGCLWVAFLKLVVQPVIESAYRGDQLLPLLDLLVEVGLLTCLLFGLVALATTSPTFLRRYVGETTAESLGAIRIITCGFLLASAVWEDLASVALLPREMRIPMGMLNFFYTFPGFEIFVESEVALQTFKWLTVLLLFLGMIGWQTRFVVPMGAFCYLILGGIIRHYEHFGHSAIVPLYLLAVLALTPCGDGLSVDRRWQVAQGKAVIAAEEPSPVYGWSRYACWVVVALVYLSSGLNKLTDGGLFWWNATNMRKIVFQDALNPAWWDWSLGLSLLPAPDILFLILGIVGFFGELGYVTVLFSRVARRVFPIVMMMMHTGIFFLQGVAFFDLILMQLIFFDFTKIRKAISKRLAASRGSIPGLHPVALPVKTPARSFFYPLLVASLSVFLLLCLIYQVEFYPFTAWQLYTGSNTSGDVTYYKVLAHQESGVISHAHLDRAIGAMKNGRYRRVMRKFCLEPTKVDICKKYLSVTGSAYNAKVGSGEKATHFEIQKWTWNFLSNPSGPEQGNLEKRFVFEIKNPENP